MNPWLPPAVLTCALLASPGALAQGVSTDIEFVRPTFGAGAYTAVDVAQSGEPMTARAGLVAQYQRVPVLLYNTDGFVIGAPVKNRAHMSLGGSLDLSKRFTVNALVPLASDWGGDPIDGVIGDGLGLGDLSAGARLSALAAEAGPALIRGGVSTQLLLPTGRKQAFLGDQSVRARLGLLASVELGPATLATDLGLLARQRLETDRGFVAGSELLWGSALAFELPEALRTAIVLQTLTRAGFANFLNQGGENAMEGIAGLQVAPTADLLLDVGFGQGFTEGMGTTDYRILAGVTFQRQPKADEPIETVVREPPPPQPPPPPIPVLEDPPAVEEDWEEGELARITENVDRIVIRDMLQFEAGTTTLLASSLPTLDAVGEILNDNASIGHLVIEGHASEDGDFGDNYTLSLGRAESVFRELLASGVHPDRVSFRGMGEVEPLRLTDASLSDEENERLAAANRRVEFHIVHNYLDVMEIPERRVRGHREPWSGQAYEVIAPRMPELPVPEPETDKPVFEEDDEEIDFDEDTEYDVRER